MKKAKLLFVIITTCVIQHVFGQTVYIADTGTKYHNQSCRTLAKSKHAINLSDAINKGYGACKICHPTQTVTGNTKTENTSDIKTQETVSTSSQCLAKTKAGKQCSRTTTSSNGKCWQHGGN